MNKVQIIQRSLQCFFWGLLSLIPVLGLCAAVITLILFFQTSRGFHEGWNPANRYLHLGASLSALSLLIQSLAILVSLFQFLT
jgi:hypothetical protein